MPDQPGRKRQLTGIIMLKMTFAEFCNIPWAVSHFEISPEEVLNGEEIIQGYIFYRNRDESIINIEEEDRIEISFPWFASINEEKHIQVEASIFDCMFTLENFSFISTDCTNNNILLQHFERIRWKDDVVLKILTTR